MNTHESIITGYSRISNYSIQCNGEILFNTDPQPFQDFAAVCYRHFKITYPKFHKMDNLCKLGFLASDILLINNNLPQNIDPFQIGVVLANKSSSLDTDIKYYNMVKKGVASPAVFVYSLPNIVIGEICIRNGIKGENAFFISDRYNIPQQVQYVNNLLDTNIIASCICGWVELIDEKYEAFLYLVEKTGNTNGKAHTIKTVEELYNS